MGRSSFSTAGARVRGMFAQPQDVLDTQGNLAMPFHFQCIGTFGAHSGPVWCLAAFDNLLFTSGSESTINVWDLGLDEPARVRVLRGHDGMVHSLTCNDRYLFSGDADGLLKVSVCICACICVCALYLCMCMYLCVCALCLWQCAGFIFALSGLCAHCPVPFFFSLASAAFGREQIWDVSSLECVRTFKATAHICAALATVDDLVGM